MLRFDDLIFSIFLYLRGSADFRVLRSCSNCLRAFNLAADMDFLYILLDQVRLVLFTYDLFLRKASLFRKYKMRDVLHVSLNNLLEAG